VLSSRWFLHLAVLISAVLTVLFRDVFDWIDAADGTRRYIPCFRLVVFRAPELPAMIFRSHPRFKPIQSIGRTVVGSFYGVASTMLLASAILIIFAVAGLMLWGGMEGHFRSRCAFNPTTMSVVDVEAANMTEAQRVFLKSARDAELDPMAYEQLAIASLPLPSRNNESISTLWSWRNVSGPNYAPLLARDVVKVVYPLRICSLALENLPNIGSARSVPEEGVSCPTCGAQGTLYSAAAAAVPPYALTPQPGYYCQDMPFTSCQWVDVNLANFNADFDDALSSMNVILTSLLRSEWFEVFCASDAVTSLVYPILVFFPTIVLGAFWLLNLCVATTATVYSDVIDATLEGEGSSEAEAGTGKPLSSAEKREAAAGEFACTAAVNRTLERFWIGRVLITLVHFPKLEFEMAGEPDALQRFSAFDVFCFVPIIANVVFLALRRPPESGPQVGSLSLIDMLFTYGNLACNCFGVLELLLRLLAHGHRYLLLRENIVDSVVVVYCCFAVATDVMVESPLPLVLRMQSFNVSRLLRMRPWMKYLPLYGKFKETIGNLFKGPQQLLAASLWTLVFVLFSAVVFMEFWKFNDERYPSELSSRMGTYTSTVLTLLDALFLVDMAETLSDTISELGVLGLALLMLYIVLTNFVFLKIFVAVILKNFELSEEDKVKVQKHAYMEAMAEEEALRSRYGTTNEPQKLGGRNEKYEDYLLAIVRDFDLAEVRAAQNHPVHLNAKHLHAEGDTDDEADDDSESESETSDLNNMSAGHEDEGLVTKPRSKISIRAERFARSGRFDLVMLVIVALSSLQQMLEEVFKSSPSGDALFQNLNFVFLILFSLEFVFKIGELVHACSVARSPLPALSFSWV
jgi:hypothetical protein